MSLISFYLLAAGIGLIGCLASIAKNPGVNRIASVTHYLGIVIVGITGWIEFDLLVMLTGIITIFLVGMILSYIVLKFLRRD